jgi:Flp pilus assembly protein TadB
LASAGSWGQWTRRFDSYQTEHQDAARPLYRGRAWLSFGGFVASLISALTALAFNWFAWSSVVYVGVAFLLISFLCVFVAALGAVRGIG